MSLDPKEVRPLTTAEVERYKHQISSPLLQCFLLTIYQQAAEIAEQKAIIELQRPLCREAGTLRDHLDVHLRRECDSRSRLDCAASFYTQAEMLWPVRPPAIITDKGRG